MNKKGYFVHSWNTASLFIVMTLQLLFSMDIKRKKNEMRVTHLHLQLQIILAESALPHFWYQVLGASGSPLVEVEAKPELSIKVFRNV